MNKICYPVFLLIVVMLLTSCMPIDEDALELLLEDQDVRTLIESGEKLTLHADRTLSRADRLLINANRVAITTNDYLHLALILFGVYVVTRVISLFQVSAIGKQLAAISDSLSAVQPTPLESQEE